MGNVRISVKTKLLNDGEGRELLFTLYRDKCGVSHYHITIIPTIPESVQVEDFTKTCANMLKGITSTSCNPKVSFRNRFALIQLFTSYIAACKDRFNKSWTSGPCKRRRTGKFYILAV